MSKLSRGDRDYQRQFPEHDTAAPQEASERADAEIPVVTMTIQNQHDHELIDQRHRLRQ